MEEAMLEEETNAEAPRGTTTFPIYIPDFLQE